MRHGEAVAYGMLAEARLATALGLAAPEVVTALERLLEAYGLAGGRPRIDLARAQEALAHDKKVSGGKLCLPLVPEIGRVLLRDDVPLGALLGALEETVGA